jgi:membrane-bound ClpP family serine protease
VATVLIAISMFGIYFELRAPGIGVGAFVCAVGLLLFFWSMYLNGTAGWLEAIFLLGGICFILLEIFVLPGFGVFGLGGALMVVAALVLASVTFVWPQSEAEIAELTRSVGIVAVAMIGVIALVTVSRRYLPNAPVFRNVVLEPPRPEERAEINQRESIVDHSNLIGVRGVAMTHLRPAGKAEIARELIDVIAEGEPLDRGTPVIVVDAHANRVVVRAVGPT